MANTTAVYARIDTDLKGIFLRKQLQDSRVQFERNTKFFGIAGTIKHEIDIAVYNETEKYIVAIFLFILFMLCNIACIACIYLYFSAIIDII